MSVATGSSTGVALTNWMVRRASGLLARKSSRRGFLMGSAMAGSAVAVAGVDFALRPGSAYAQVTGCPPGSYCSDGYTEFCCSLTGGLNVCPSDSFAGGWWRADFSSFCNGTRYYIDCMQYCFGPDIGGGFCAGTQECRCANGCDTRRVYCNYFRYGQCHQEIAQTGPIACRVVSCVPPYTVAEYACSTAAAVDNSTAEHFGNCPPAPPPPPQATRRKARNVIQVMLYDTLNVFYIGDDGALLQKVFAPGPGADNNGWRTTAITAAGRCKVGSDVDVQDGYQNNVHVFAKAADGQHMVHCTWIRSQTRWVEQTH